VTELPGSLDWQTDSAPIEIEAQLVRRSAGGLRRSSHSASRDERIVNPLPPSNLRQVWLVLTGLLRTWALRMTMQLPRSMRFKAGNYQGLSSAPSGSVLEKPALGNFAGPVYLRANENDTWHSRPFGNDTRGFRKLESCDRCD
jgi:hypothetical protein